MLLAKPGWPRQSSMAIQTSRITFSRLLAAGALSLTTTMMAGWMPVLETLIQPRRSSNIQRQHSYAHGSVARQDGHAEAYGIKFWNIGNEMYGFWQIGHTALRYYVPKNNAFARAMRKADPSITLIACGARPDAMTVTGNARLTANTGIRAAGRGST
jgi:hypothetical protein